MHGPGILVRSLGRRFVADRHGNVWQYHSRSDRHSKIGCWGVLFDLLETCPVLRGHVRDGRVGFGINHQMTDFKTHRDKNLDLVVCTPGTMTGRFKRRSFADLVEDYGLSLSDDERRLLEAMPYFPRVPVGSVFLALEAKACMTAHVRALPRLYDELTSSHLTIHASADNAVAAGLVMINFSEEFVSPDLNKMDLSVVAPNLSRHDQPRDAARTLAKVREIRRRTRPGEEGFDALGVVCVAMRNDGGAVISVAEPPAPRPNEPFHYEAMIRRAAHSYESRFAGI